MLGTSDTAANAGETRQNMLSRRTERLICRARILRHALEKAPPPSSASMQQKGESIRTATPLGSRDADGIVDSQLRHHNFRHDTLCGKTGLQLVKFAPRKPATRFDFIVGAWLGRLAYGRLEYVMDGR